MWYTYILELSNSKTYVGYASDLRERLKRHNAGNVYATRDYLPARLKVYISVDKEEKARDLERYLKSGSGRAFMKRHLFS